MRAKQYTSFARIRHAYTTWQILFSSFPMARLSRWTERNVFEACNEVSYNSHSIQNILRCNAYQPNHHKVLKTQYFRSRFKQRIPRSFRPVKVWIQVAQSYKVSAMLRSYQTNIVFCGGNYSLHRHLAYYIPSQVFTMFFVIYTNTATKDNAALPLDCPSKIEALLASARASWSPIRIQSTTKCFVYFVSSCI